MSSNNNPLVEAVFKNVRTLTERAEELIAVTYRTYGRCTLLCECGAWECTIDADALDCHADTSRVRDLIEHARYDHANPHNVVATVTHVALDTHVL